MQFALDAAVGAAAEAHQSALLEEAWRELDTALRSLPPPSAPASAADARQYHRDVLALGLAEPAGHRRGGGGGGGAAPPLPRFPATLRWSAAAPLLVKV